MDPRDFHTLSKRLVAGSMPAELRAAISSAYYGSYGLARKLFRDMGFSVPTTHKGHTQVQFYLNNCSDNDARKAGSKLVALYSKRLDADYKMEDRAVENRKTAQALVTQAEDIIRVLDNCAIEPKRSTIKSGVHAYLDKIKPSP